MGVTGPKVSTVYGSYGISVVNTKEFIDKKLDKES